MKPFPGVESKQSYDFDKWEQKSFNWFSFLSVSTTNLNTHYSLKLPKQIQNSLQTHKMVAQTYEDQQFSLFEVSKKSELKVQL